MKDNDVWDLIELPKGRNRLDVNEYSKPSGNRKVCRKVYDTSCQKEIHSKRGH